MKKTSVLVADDVRLVNEGICSLLEPIENVCVIGQAMDGEACLDFLQKSAVDLLLLDHQMPKLDGFAVLQQIRAAKIPVKVILLTLLTEESIIQQYLNAGIDGCLLKHDLPDEFLFGIQQVIKGETYFSSAVAQVLARQASQNQRSRANGHQELNGLTRSEWEVLTLIGKGFSVQEVSEIRHRSVQTINKQKQSIMNKLGIHKETKLMKFALDYGIR